MIRITCEMWPGADRSRKYLLGEMSITNDGAGTRERGNYRVMLKRGTRGSKVRCTELFNFPRKTRSVFELMRRALNKLQEEKNLP